MFPVSQTSVNAPFLSPINKLALRHHLNLETMATFRRLAVSLALIATVASALQLADALRGGAPALACRSLRPVHGLHRPKPASASQFFITQSTLDYAPGETVTVEIATHSNERFFRGFLVQAYDPSNGERLGKFLPSELSQPVWCSAATHRNHNDKRYIELKWLDSTDSESRPERARRQVRFRGTIVVTYGEFYTGFESSDRNFARFDFKKQNDSLSESSD